MYYGYKTENEWHRMRDMNVYTRNRIKCDYMLYNIAKRSVGSSRPHEDLDRDRLPSETVRHCA